MEGSLNGTLEETQKVESQSEKDKEVEIKSSVDSAGEVSVNENPVSVIEQPKENEEENTELIDTEKLEEKQEVSESVVESLVASISDFTEEVKESVENLEGSDKNEFELKQEEVEDLPSQEEASEFSPTVVVVENLEDKDLPSSVEKNELPTVLVDGSLGTQRVETNEVLEKTEETQAPSLEDNSGSSLPSSDVVSKVTEETTLIKSDGTDKTEVTLKGIEETDTDVRIEESSVVQETSKETTNESSQPEVNFPADETTGAIVQDKTEIPRSIENPTTISVNKRQQAGWSSCCGLLEVLRGGNR